MNELYGVDGRRKGGIRCAEQASRQAGRLRQACTLTGCPSNQPDQIWS